MKRWDCTKAQKGKKNMTSIGEPYDTNPYVYLLDSFLNGNNENIWIFDFGLPINPSVSTLHRSNYATFKNMDVASAF